MGGEVIYANVGRDGVIVFEPRPDPSLGRLPVGSAGKSEAARFRRIVAANARHAHDGVTLLVPGVPEAATRHEALGAMLRFRQLIDWRMAGKMGWPPAYEAS
jgi:hypothetical protein